MQGRYIPHTALRALGTRERITLVTSLRPRSPLLPDDSDLHTVRGISDIHELHYQYASYRLEILQARIENQVKGMREAHARGVRVETGRLRGWLAEQGKFLERMGEEIWEDDAVVVGRQPEMGFEDV